MRRLFEHHCTFFLVITIFLASCQTSKPPAARLLFLTAPTNIRFSPEEGIATYDVMILDQGRGELTKVGQVSGTGCLSWSEANKMYLRIYKDQIHLLNQDLRQDTPLVVKEMLIYSASWTPDGQKIIFSGEMREGAFGRNNIFLMEKDGTNIRELGYIKDKFIFSYEPVVSPDGSQIVFVSNRDFDTKGTNETDFDIFIMDIEGKNVRRLPFDPGDAEEGNPVWSPDGRNLVFLSSSPNWGHNTNVRNIFRFDLENQSSTQLTHSTNLLQSETQWSLDGKKIAFTHRRVDLFQPQPESIAIISADGKDVQEIACEKDYSCFCPLWVH